MKKDIIKTNTNNTEKISEYNTSNPLFDKISSLIKQKQTNIVRNVNSEMISLYWEIGELICVNVLNNSKADYGQKIVEEISKNLVNLYGKGFNRASIFRMVQFYQCFPDKQIVATLSQQLTWSHFVELLPIENETKRDFYATMCKNENWSVRVLRERKNSMLFERTAISKKTEKTIKNEISGLINHEKISLNLFYRDPYVLDFLGLKDTFCEKDLENAILSELEKFILEMGSDFAFLARQKHFVLERK